MWIGMSDVIGKSGFDELQVLGCPVQFPIGMSNVDIRVSDVGFGLQTFGSLWEI